MNIYEMINDTDFTFINTFAESNYGFKMTKEIFISQIQEYNQELISKLITKFRIDILNGDPEMLYEIISKYLQPNETQKKKNGEVFTPLNLVTEMLNKLPEEVWSNKNLKWLDPCVGIGNFPIIIYKKLMKGLETEIPDEKERSSHILENMIYATDICPINISIYKTLLGVKNTFIADFLNPETFKDQTFDIIVGNPPYQKGSSNGKAVGGRGLWEDFVFSSFSRLNENGYLCFIHPQGWRRPDNKTGTSIKQHEFIHLDLHSKPFKDVGVWVDWYILKKNNNGQYKNLILIPNKLESISIIKKIISYKGDKIEFKRDYTLSSLKKHLHRKKSDTEFNIPVFNNQNTITYTNKSHIEKRKKIVSGDSSLKYFYDDEKNIGEHAFYIFVKSKCEGEYLLKLLNSKLYKWFVEINQIGNFQIDYKLVNQLPIINDVDNIYKILNLTLEEIKIVEMG